MKVNLYEAGGRFEGGFSIPGMTLTGPLLLSGTVTAPLEAIHKQYIDTAVTNLDASSFMSGTIATARMPGLTGDVTSNNSSNVVSLNASGVIAGDYTKVTVDAKGRVTTGLSLTEADLPNISWSKISAASKPTTLAGYGITDGVSTVNATLTGSLTLSDNPSEANHASTKAYADANVAGGAKIVTGDIINGVSNVPQSGFLRCNGGELSKTVYSALYAVIGDTFSTGVNMPGAGRPWDQHYAINSSQNAALGTWSAGTAFPTVISGAMVVVTKNRVYVYAGENASGYSAAGYTAPINSDGTIGTWTTTTAFSRIGTGGSMIVTKNRVYAFGMTNGAAHTSVYTAPINTDGTIGTWVAATSLLSAVSLPTCFITRNRLYVIYAGVAQYASINADGTLGAWVTETMSGLHAWIGSIPVVTKNRVYLLGGSGGGQYRSDVITAAINADGSLGNWAPATSMPAELVRSAIYVTRERVYIITGSRTGTGTTAPTNGIWSAAINVDGTLGAWRTDPVYGQALAGVTMFATSTRLYGVGGSTSNSATTGIATVYSVPIIGGLNDYTKYYDGTIMGMDANNFKLPDYTLYEKTNLYYYIKS